MVNSDVLEALELLTHKGFTENISNYAIVRNKQIEFLNNIKIKNKKILLKDITGDIIFDIIKKSPLLIDYNLNNIFAKYYIDLKIVFIIKY
ncbi:MAG TPA: hypothetical protein PLV83_02925 [Bacilli bacterium]|nr:hypothetical protein [Bacilli bacterium]